MQWDLDININNSTAWTLQVRDTLNHVTMAEISPGSQWRWLSTEAALDQRHWIRHYFRFQFDVMVQDPDHNTIAVLTTVLGRSNAALVQMGPSRENISVAADINGVGRTAGPDLGLQQWPWNTMLDGGRINLVFGQT